MLKNYIKIAWRSLIRNKSYAFINIGGLAVALAVFIIIILFVRHELSYDSFFSDADQIYRVVMVEDDGYPSNIHLEIPEPIAGELKQFYPEVDQSVRISGPYRDVLLEGENKVYSKGWAEVGTAYFSIFDFPFIAGDPSTALSEPKSVVITKVLAEKLYGSENALGKTLVNNTDEAYIVTGVIENPPSNTHFNIEAFAYRNEVSMKKWNYRTGFAYIKLNRAEQVSSLRKKLPAYVKEYQQLSEAMLDDYRLILQPVRDIHMYPKSREAQSSRMFYIQVLLLVAGLILLVACINYMNLATARSAGRAREIGIRKTVGAQKRQVVAQVMAESTLTVLCAFLVSFFLVELFKPLALRYFDVNLGSLYQLTLGWTGFLGGLVVIVSILSGIYAAFYLSSFQPNEVLKGSGLQSGRGASVLRKILVVAQFGISIAIVIASLLISKQMEFVRTERLNGNDEQVMVIRNNSTTLAEQFDTFKEELLRDKSVHSVSAGTIPNDIGSTAGFTDSEKTVNLSYFHVEYDYLETLGLKLVEGRDFSPWRSQDSTQSVILNKTAASALGYDQAEGQTIDLIRKNLIGIVEDFHSHTLFDPIEPVVISIIAHSRSRMNIILVRLNEGQIASGLDHVQQVWSKFAPTYPLNFQFLDDVLDQDYRAELRLAKIFNVFSVFSILIACLGLFGLATYTAERRTKEIGIRKVLGATVANIVALLSKDFVKLVIIGFVIAIPIAWYAMNQWLADFAYKIEIGAGIFVLAGGTALVISLLTVSWQSVKAAVANPVDSLRSE